jgi:hypothetical protein
MPGMIYGTAWKGLDTERLTYAAIQAGFRAVDTGSVGDHYDEQAVGRAIRSALADGFVKREELYIQTKFTWYEAGKQGRPNVWPYDPQAPLSEQIQQSVESSLCRLEPGVRGAGGDESGIDGEAYLDCLILHSPSPDGSLTKTYQALKLLDSYTPHPIRTIGISNIHLPDLTALFPRPGNKADLQLAIRRGLEPSPHSSLRLPSLIQNPFVDHPRSYLPTFDREVRQFCLDREIAYQAYHVLTGNRYLWDGTAPGPVTKLAKLVGISNPEALFGLCCGCGVRCLSGTRRVSEGRSYGPGQQEKIVMWRKSGREAGLWWRACLGAFRGWVNEGRWVTENDVEDAFDEMTKDARDTALEKRIGIAL